MDIWKFIHFDFGVDIVASAVNWAIFTDLTYSFYFLLPSVFFVFIRRSEVGRAVILNFVERSADHPKGVLYFLGELMMAWLTVITKMISGK